jgi:hypothetical protein
MYKAVQLNGLKQVIYLWETECGRPLVIYLICSICGYQFPLCRECYNEDEGLSGLIRFEKLHSRLSSKITLNNYHL